jgi:biotin operon repressor
MLLRRDELEAIAEGRVTVALRRWRRPTVRTGGTLLTAIGQLSIISVECIDAITLQDARAAGFATLEAAHAALGDREGVLYRIALRLIGPDPRIALQQGDTLDAIERAEITARLARLDAAQVYPWTAQTLTVIADNPERPARELARLLGRERDALKADIRKLKALGLTVSLETGYRLSPRGRAYLDKTG